ncbi:MAG: hypothetical protein ABII89_05460 [Candidatus Omnitrophota bacterium]
MAVFCRCPDSACAGEETTTASVQPEGAEQVDCIWITIRDDYGSDESHWGTAGHPAQVLCKIIRLNIEPEQIKDAIIRYKIGCDPYHAKLQAYFNSATEGVAWADVVIRVNDETVTRKSPVEIATLGWHEIPVKPGLLKRGDNTIKFSWAEIPGDNPLNASYGVFYMGIDTAGKARRSCSSVDYGKTFRFDTLRPHYAPDKAWQGEYMVRLGIALPCE